MLDELGSDPSTFDAKGLRAFLLQWVGVSSPAKAKNIATALRMFLRFLIARGRCALGLEQAVPTVAKWRLASLPKYPLAFHNITPGESAGAHFERSDWR